MSFFLEEGIIAKSSATPTLTLFFRDRMSSLTRSQPGGQNFSQSVTIMSRSVIVPSKSQKTTRGLAMAPQRERAGQFRDFLFGEGFEIVFLKRLINSLAEGPRAGAGAFGMAM